MPLDYENLRDAVDDVSRAKGASETIGAGARLLGKAIFNAGLFTAREMPNLMAHVAERQLKDGKNIPAEKRERMQNFIDKNKRK